VCRPLDFEIDNLRIDADQLAEMLQAPLFSRLRRLRLCSNGLDAACAKVIAQSANLTNLEILDLAVNVIGTRGLQHLLDSPYLSRLRILGLWNNQLDDDACAALAASPRLGQLRFVNLRGNSEVTHAGSNLILRSPAFQGMFYLGCVDDGIALSSPTACRPERATLCLRGNTFLGYPSEDNPF
jgi:hypothetical protein